MSVRLMATTAAIAAIVALSACSQGGQAPSQPPQDQGAQGQGGGDFGGYGPFGDSQQTPTQQAGAMGGAERVIAGGGVTAPAEFQTLISKYLETHAGQMAEGWRLMPGVPDVITSLQAGGEHQWQVFLRGGQRYAIIGACDNECSDVDLIVMDGAGGHAGSDVLEDDYPLVSLQPAADGLYTVRIVLNTCTVAPCYVGARIVVAP